MATVTVIGGCIVDGKHVNPGETFRIPESEIAEWRAVGGHLDIAPDPEEPETATPASDPKL